MKFKAWKYDYWMSKEGNFLTFDKLEHFLYSFLVGVAALFITWHASLFSFIVLSFGKEFYDGVHVLKNGNIQGWSWKDVIANLVGYSCGFLTYWVLK